MDDPTIAARQEGYSWDEIDAHIGQASQQATEAGYGQDEIDQYLGGSNPAPFEERLQTGWAHQLAADPKLDVSDLTSGPTHRSDYAHGLKEGYVRGPQDFADRYAAAMVGASGADRGALGGAADAASDLAASLPAKRDFTDAAVALGGDDVQQTRANVIDHWRDTGTPPIDAAMQAQQDPALHAALTKTPEPDKLPWWSGDPEAAAASMTSETMMPAIKSWWDWRLSGVAEDAKKADESVELMKKIHAGDATPEDRQKFLDLSVERGLDVGLGFGPGTIGKLSGGVFDAIIGKFAKAAEKEPKFEVLNLGADKPVTELPASEAVAPVEPAKMIEPEPTAEGVVAPEAKANIDPEAAPAEKMLAVGKLHADGAIEGVPAEQPNFFQSLYDKAVEDGHMASDPAVEQLAIGHDMAENWWGNFKAMMPKMMRDEAGAVPLPALHTPEQAAGISERRAADIYSKDKMIASRGAYVQEMREFADRYKGMEFQIRKAQDAFDAEYAKGPGGLVRDTDMGKALLSIEGRTPGVVLDANNPVTPWIDRVKEGQSYIHARGQQLAAEGRMNEIGYIRDYLPHMVKNPTLVEDNLRASGRLGARGNFMERQGPPSIVELIEHGAELKTTNLVELIHADAAAKLKAYHAADLFADFVDDGKAVWAASKGSAPKGWVSLTRASEAWAKKDLPLDAIAKVGENGEIAATGAPRSIELYAHPKLERNLRYWMKQTDMSDGARSIADKLLYMKNQITGLKLAGPGFHADTELVASWSNQYAKVLDEASRGQMFEALKSIAGLPTAPYRAVRSGRKLIDDLNNGNVDRSLALAVKNNMNLTGIHALEDITGDNKSIYQSIMAGRTMGELLTGPKKELGGMLWRDIYDNWARLAGDAKDTYLKRGLKAPATAVDAALTEVQRFMSTVNAPLFKGVIPPAKLAGFYDRMNSFFKAYPDASEAKVDKYARQLAQDVENRMGELQIDNLFWPMWMKRTLQTALISTSWKYGTYRNLFSGLTQYNFERGFELNPVAFRSLIGTGMTLASIASVEEYVRTGKLPDYASPATYAGYFKTGGLGSGLARGMPEFSAFPSEWKEVADLATIMAKSWTNPFRALPAAAEYVLGAFNPAFQLVKSVATGTDRIGHDIYALGWKHTVAALAKDLVLPIPLAQLEDRKKSTGLAVWESLMGQREAPKWLENWQGWQKWQQTTENKSTKAEIQRARRENADLETPQDLSDLPAVPGAARPSAGGGIRNSATPREARALGGAAGGGGIRNGADFGGASRSVAGGDVSPGLADPIVRRGGERAALTNEQLFNRLRRRGGGRRGRR